MASPLPPSAPSVKEAKETHTLALLAIKTAENDITAAVKRVADETAAWKHWNLSIKSAQRTVDSLGEYGGYVINRSREADGTPTSDNNEEAFNTFINIIQVGPRKKELAYASLSDARVCEEVARAALVKAFDAAVRAKAGIEEAKVAAREKAKEAKLAVEVAKKAAARASAAQAIACDSPIARFLNAQLAARDPLVPFVSVEGAAFREEFRAWAVAHNDGAGSDYNAKTVTHLLKNFGFHTKGGSLARTYSINWFEVGAKVAATKVPVSKVAAWYRDRITCTHDPTDRIKARELYTLFKANTGEGLSETAFGIEVSQVHGDSWEKKHKIHGTMAYFGIRHLTL